MARLKEEGMNAMCVVIVNSCRDTARNPEGNDLAGVPRNTWKDILVSKLQW
jgi:hypothetical protein